MRIFGIFPIVDMTDQNAAGFNDCISLVTKIVCSKLRAGGDTFHTAIDWRDPGGEAWSICTEGTAEPHVIPLSDPGDLECVVRLSVDPRSVKSAGVIRSIATCRAVAFGYDGQAFLCLRHEDSAPTSPDPTLIVVEERPDLLVESDYFDGTIVSPINDNQPPPQNSAQSPES